MAYREFAFAVAALGLSISGPVLADDLDPQGYPAIWKGLYFGLHVGDEWAHATITDLDAYAAGATPGTKTADRTSGVFGGGQLGYNFQSGAFVYGMEADVGHTGFADSTFLTGTASGTRVGIGSGAYADITGRLGLAYGPALFYAKGGWAFFDGNENFSTVTGSFSSKNDTSFFSGWTLGGGIEYKLRQNISLKVEYMHTDYGTQDFTVFNAGLVPFRFKDNLDADAVKIGFNIGFNGAPEEVAPLK